MITVIPPAYTGNRGQTLSFPSARQPRSGPPMTLIEVLSRCIPGLLLLMLRSLRSLMRLLRVAVVAVDGITFESSIRIPRNLRVPIDVIMSAYQFLSPKTGPFTSLLGVVNPGITGNVGRDPGLVDALPTIMMVVVVGRSSTFADSR